MDALSRLHHKLEEFSNVSQSFMDELVFPNSYFSCHVIHENVYGMCVLHIRPHTLHNTYGLLPVRPERLLIQQLYFNILHLGLLHSLTTKFPD